MNTVASNSHPLRNVGHISTPIPGVTALCSIIEGNCFNINNPPVHCRRLRLSGLVYLLPLLLLFTLSGPAHGQIFIMNNTHSTVGEYTTSGSTVNSSLISNEGGAMTLSGSDLFTSNGSRVAEYTTSGAVVSGSLFTLGGINSMAVSGSYIFAAYYNYVGEYTTSGATVNASLISILGPTGIAISGSDIFITSNNAIAEYTTSGALVSGTLISGLSGPAQIAISGTNLFVVNSLNGTVGEYNTVTGATIHAALISNLGYPWGIAISGSDLFVSTSSGVGEYTTSGAMVSGTLVSDPDATYIAVVQPVPEPSTLIMLAGGVVLLTLYHQTKRMIGR